MVLGNKTFHFMGNCNFGRKVNLVNGMLQIPPGQAAQDGSSMNDHRRPWLLTVLRMGKDCSEHEVKNFGVKTSFGNFWSNLRVGYLADFFFEFLRN